MAHIYGHSWPVRWGKVGQLRSVHVYSNCERAKLFLNGVSQGTRNRDSQDFPAAGLRWDLIFVPGLNHLRVEAHTATTTLIDAVDLTYQTDPWGTPAVLEIREKEREGNRISVEAKLFDAQGVLCLEARSLVRFSLYGAGRLNDNLGTTRGSRQLQQANGRAEISFVATGACTVEAAVEGLSAASLRVSS